MKAGLLIPPVVLLVLCCALPECLGAEETGAVFDHAMLDSAKGERLRNQIERGMAAFESNVPRKYHARGESGTPWRLTVR